MHMSKKRKNKGEEGEGEKEREKEIIIITFYIFEIVKIKSLFKKLYNGSLYSNVCFLGTAAFKI